jgi:anti-sigma regulatory factor (Ser/Thr protein kinase)
MSESRIRIAGVLEQIPGACDFVADAARAAGLDERAAYHCQLAVDEACTNIVEHGYGAENAGKFIDIICRVDSRYFTITIIDESPAFNPLVKDDPDPTAVLEDRGTGGWGIYFIKKLMDEVSYLHEAHHNRLVMMKKLGAS